MRIEGKFCRGINVIWVVQSPSQKYSGSLLTQITSISFASRPNTEGRFAIVTNVGHGMRWTQAALLTRALCLRTAKSCGPDASMVGVKSAELSAGDGDKQARSPGRARRKPLKPLRAGMPGDPGATVVTNARAFYSTRAAAGATGTRHSPLPLGAAPRPPFQGERFKHNSSASRGGNAEVCVKAFRAAHRLHRRHPEEAATRPSRRTTARAAHPSRLAALAPQDGGPL